MAAQLHTALHGHLMNAPNTSLLAGRQLCCTVFICHEVVLAWASSHNQRKGITLLNQLVYLLN
jgi:hypothetical protein